MMLIATLHSARSLSMAGDNQSDDGVKGRSLASRLLSKKGDKRAEQLSFGGHAQSAQRRGSSLPTFDLNETSTQAYAARQQSLPPPAPSPSPFAPQAASDPSVELSRQSTDDLEALPRCIAALTANALRLEPLLQRVSAPNALTPVFLCGCSGIFKADAFADDEVLAELVPDSAADTFVSAGAPTLQYRPTP